MREKGSRRILVVDDDENIRGLCVEVLSVAGYRVRAASNGAEALDLMKRSRIDMVITDVSMPEVGGIDLYSQALRDFPALKGRFIFMTGDLTPELESAFTVEELKYLVKPFRIAELLLSVDDVLARELSGTFMKNEIGKREEARFTLSADCDVFEEGLYRERYIVAMTENVSRNGIKIAYEGVPFPEGAAVSVYLSVNGLSIHRYARVVWSRPVDARMSAAGIRFDEPMPVSSIVSVIPARAV